MDFSRVVRWSIYALLDAESKGITQTNAEAVGRSSQWPPSGSANSLGLAPGWARDMVVTVGNYGEIYDRHQGLGHTSPLVRGINRLWHHGGLLFAPPLQ
jgi:general L-amino acid transport system substrate-binding protein